jgi:hypothetical protein
VIVKAEDSYKKFKTSWHIISRWTEIACAEVIVKAEDSYKKVNTS